MSLVKVGDEQPIIEFYNNDGEKQICPDCGASIHTIYVDGKQHRLVCKKCDYVERVGCEK